MGISSRSKPLRRHLDVVEKIREADIYTEEITVRHLQIV